MEHQQQTRGSATAGVFRLCTIVTLAMAFSLLCASIFSLWRFTAHDGSDWAIDHDQLTPAYQYFDTNRNSGAILWVHRLQGDTATLKTAKCGSGTYQKGWEKKEALTQFRGTVAGCLANGVLTKGKCTAGQLSTGETHNAFGARALNRWRTEPAVSVPTFGRNAAKQNMFCILRTLAVKFQAKDTDECPTGYKGNCGNHCYQNPDAGQTDTNRELAASSDAYSQTQCPLGEWFLGLTSDTRLAAGHTYKTGEEWNAAPAGGSARSVYYKRLTTATTQDAESVDVSVSWYGAECTNPNNAAVDPTQQFVLMATRGSGCGTLGLNKMSEKADGQKAWEFLADNYALLVDDATPANNALSLPQFKQQIEEHQSQTVQLNNQRRILVRPTRDCDEFRFNTQNHATNLLNHFDSIWNLIKWMGIVATSTALLAVMMLLLVVLIGYRNQSQTFMTALYTICLIGLFVCVVMMWKARYLINTNYSVPYQHFGQAVTNNCISDQGWQGMLNSWYTHTSFGNMASALLYLLVLFVFMLLVGVIFAIWALMGLAKTANNRV